MIERKCMFCGNIVQIDADNSNRAIQYQNSFFHYDCFEQYCSEKLQAKSVRWKQHWTNIKAKIDVLVEETTKKQRNIVFKDEVYRFMVKKYNLSFVSDQLFSRLDSIYDGTYSGLTHPIPAEELFNEWQYYFDMMYEQRKNKNLFGENAIKYDLAILMSKNAEYREVIRRRKVEEETRMIEMRNNEIDMNRIKSNVSKSNKRVSEFLKEMND